MKAIPLLCLSLLALTACAPKPQSEKTLAAALIDQQLHDATEAISHDLALLSGSRQILDASQIDDNPVLAQRISLQYDGPLKAALEKVCATIGYQLVVEGKPEEPYTIVHVHELDKPARKVIRQIGVQSTPYEQISLLEDQRKLRLSYLSKH